MAFYAHDDALFAFDVSPPRQYLGWKKYRADYQGFLDDVVGSPWEKITDLNITVSGDVAYTHAIAEIGGTLRHGGKFDAVLRVTDVLRKIDGRWLVVQEHLSVPVDLVTGKADLRSKP